MPEYDENGNEIPEKKKTRSQEINEQNPDADPSKPYVQAGDTGGYLDGVGVTLGEGTSITAGDRDRYLQDARNVGLSDSTVQDFLKRNPGDYNRIVEAYADDGGGDGGGGREGGQPRSLASQWTSQTSQRDPRWDALYQRLLERSSQGLAIDRTDPTVRAQADAYAANEQRASRSALADMAEKAGPYANMTSERRLAGERVGQRTGAYEAELMGREVQARRDEIAQALVSMQGMLTQEQEVSLRQELAQLDAMLRQQQMALQEKLAMAGLSQDWQTALMRDRQFYSDLGLQAEDRATYYDLVRRGVL